MRFSFAMKFIVIFLKCDLKTCHGNVLSFDFLKYLKIHYKIERISKSISPLLMWRLLCKHIEKLGYCKDSKLFVLPVSSFAFCTFWSLNLLFTAFLFVIDYTKPELNTFDLYMNFVYMLGCLFGIWEKRHLTNMFHWCDPAVPCACFTCSAFSGCAKR